MVATMSNLVPQPPGALAAYSASQHGAQETSGDPFRLLTALRKRWKVFTAVALGFIALVALFTLIAPKSYTASVRLMAGRPGTETGPPSADTSLPILNALVLQSGQQSAETFALLAQQRGIASRVIDELGLHESPEALLGKVSVKPVVNTSLLNLSVTARSRDESAQVANAFATAFVDQEREFVRSQAVAALGYLATELPAAEDRMHAASQRLAAFQATNGFFDATAQEQDYMTRVTTIDQKIDTLIVDQNEARQLLKNTQSQIGSTSPTIASAEQVGPDPDVLALHAKLTDAQAQLTEARAQYTDSHPAVIALKQQVAALQAQLATHASSSINGETVAPNPIYQSLVQQQQTQSARVDGDEAQLKSLRAERAKYGPAIKALPTELVQFAKLQEDAKRATNIYNELEQKNSDALVAKTTAISDVLIVQPAVAADAVVSPNLMLNLAIATAIGLVLGLGVIALLEWIERRTSAQDVARRLGLPLMARIPDFGAESLSKRHWVQSMTLEAFLHLCVALRLRSERRLRTLAVLSPSRGDGKSTISFHLARAMATLKGPILLVDADLRRPTLHEHASVGNEAGLSEVLAGSKTLDDSVQHISPGLDLLSSGTSVTNPVSLLEMGLSHVLEMAEKQYAMVIVDGPALGAVTDALLVAMVVDGSLLVVGPNPTDEREAQNLVERLRSFGIENLLGIVMNREKIDINDYTDYFAGVNTTRQLPGSAS